jgi:hypothetical protein
MNKPWVLIVNSDIAFFPGTLQNIVSSYHYGPVQFDIGFMSLTGHWSGVIITRHCIDTIGYFDENIYPAFYEDDDYGIRIQHAKLKPYIIPNTSALHGETDGSKGYVSGTGTLINSKDEKADPDWKRLGAQVSKGMSHSQWYLSKKWGWKPQDFLFGGKHEICKYPEGMEGKCVTPYTHPFNNESNPLRYWKLNMWALRRIFAIY